MSIRLTTPLPPLTMLIHASQHSHISAVALKYEGRGIVAGTMSRVRSRRHKVVRGEWPLRMQPIPPIHKWRGGDQDPAWITDRVARPQLHRYHCGMPRHPKQQWPLHTPRVRYPRLSYLTGLGWPDLIGGEDARAPDQDNAYEVIMGACTELRRTSCSSYSLVLSAACHLEV